MNFQPIRPIMTGPSSFQNSNSNIGFNTLQTATNSSQPQGTSSLSSLNLDLSFGGSKPVSTMPVSKPVPTGFGMGTAAPPVVPGRPYDWTVKPGMSEKFILRLF